MPRHRCQHSPLRNHRDPHRHRRYDRRGGDTIRRHRCRRHCHGYCEGMVRHFRPHRYLGYHRHHHRHSRHQDRRRRHQGDMNRRHHRHHRMHLRLD